jgi:glutamate---cysteine ligase / carboxylate-amine ligase
VASSFELGVEEELLFVDAETFEVRPGFSRVVGEGDDRVKPELFESFVELTTPALPDAYAVLAELRRARAAIAERAVAHGLTVYAAGSHPLASGHDQELVPLPRYEQMAKAVGPGIWRQLVCGLHVHVSVDDPLRVFEAVVPWLPTLLALSANSPYLESEDTGLRSARAEALLAMPTGGTPPLVSTWDEWKRITGGDSTRRHWDAWPRPEYGTVEVRVMDMQTDVRRTAGFAAIVQALVETVSETQSVSETEPYERTLYAQRRREAARRAPDPREVEALADLVGDDPLARLVLEGRPEAERQLELGITGVPQDVVARTLG